jgi:hypothetical protein
MTNGLVAGLRADPACPVAPIQGGELLARLRGDTSLRPVIDPGLSGGLREWLEDGLCGFPVRPDQPLVVTKQLLRDAMAGRTENADRREPTVPMAIGVLMDALFRQLVTVGSIEDPMSDALAALGVDPRRAEIIDFVERLGDGERSELEDEVETQSAIVVRRWPRLSPSWLPRTQERIAVPLAGGAVVLVGIIDLMIGLPSTGRASVGIIEAKSGRPRIEDREDLRFYALLETLRSGAAPFRTATFYTRTGDTDVEDVSDQALASSVQRVLAGLGRIVGAA